jgi:hypothetical protein
MSSKSLMPKRGDIVKMDTYMSPTEDGRSVHTEYLLVLQVLGHDDSDDVVDILALYSDGSKGVTFVGNDDIIFSWKK